MKKRLFSTVLLWSVVGSALYFGKVWGGLALLAVATGAAHWECSQILRKCGGVSRSPFAIVLGVLLVIGAGVGLLVEPPWIDVRELSGAWGPWRVVAPGMFAGAIALVTLFVRPAKLADVFIKIPSAFSWLYIPCSMMPLAVLAAETTSTMRVTGANTGLLLVLWVVAVVKFSDCGALIAGLSCGEKRHRMAPTISPGKSWEGCVGGVVTAAGIAAGLAWLFGHYHTELGFSAHVAAQFTPAKAALFGLLLGALAIPSDLIESALKRRAGVKDSGGFLPGVGGAFDLLDSLILTSPVAYVLLKLTVLA